LESPQLLCELAGFLQEQERIAHLLASLTQEEPADVAAPQLESRADASEQVTSEADPGFAAWLRKSDLPDSLDWFGFVSKTGIQRWRLESWTPPLALGDLLQLMGMELPQRLSSKRFDALLRRLAAAQLELAMYDEGGEDEANAVPLGTASPGIAAWVRLRLRPSGSGRRVGENGGTGQAPNRQEVPDHSESVLLIRLLGMWRWADWREWGFPSHVPLRRLYNALTGEEAQRLSRRRVEEVEERMAEVGLCLFGPDGNAIGDGPLPQEVALLWRQ
jgi:hypothetical protein